MNLTDLHIRIERLDKLARGLAKEVSMWKECNDPLLYLERKAYLNGILDALSGIESARVALAQAKQRLMSAEEIATQHPQLDA